MRALYLLTTTMLSGLFLMFVSSYKLLSHLGAARAGVLVPSGARPYVAVSYLGLGLFLVGGIGALIMLVRSLMRRS